MIWYGNWSELFRKKFGEAMASNLIKIKMIRPNLQFMCVFGDGEFITLEEVEQYQIGIE